MRHSPINTPLFVSLLKPSIVHWRRRKAPHLNISLFTSTVAFICLLLVLWQSISKFVIIPNLNHCTSVPTKCCFHEALICLAEVFLNTFSFVKASSNIKECLNVTTFGCFFIQLICFLFVLCNPNSFLITNTKLIQ